MCALYCLTRSPMANLAERVADDGAGVAGQVLKVLCGFATNVGLSRQDDAELAQQTTYAVEGGDAGGNKALTSAVHHQARLLSMVFTGTKRMVGRCTASQIAATLTASFLPRLPLIR